MSRRRGGRARARGGRCALLLAALLAVGCGGGELRGSLRVDAPLSDVVRAHQAIAVRGAAKNPAWEPEAQRIAARLMPRLEELGIFSAVVDRTSSSKTELELSVTVTELVPVTPDDRQKLGSSAGQARLVVDVRLKEKATGAEVGAATLEATAHEGPKGGTTEDLEDEVLRRLVAWLGGRPIAD